MVGPPLGPAFDEHGQPPFCRLHPGQRLIRLEAEVGRPAVYVHADGTVHGDRWTDAQSHATEHAARFYQTAGWIAGLDKPQEKYGASCDGECAGHYRGRDLMAVYEALALTPCKLPPQAKLMLRPISPNRDFLAELRRLADEDSVPLAVASGERLDHALDVAAEGDGHDHTDNERDRGVVDEQIDNPARDGGEDTAGQPEANT